MSYLYMQGTVKSVFMAPTGVNRKTGAEYGGDGRVQLETEVILQNGERRYDMFTMSCGENKQRFEEFKTNQGKMVRCAVTPYASNGVVKYMLDVNTSVESVSVRKML